MTLTSIAAPSFIWFREGLEAYLIIQMAWMMVSTHKQKFTIVASTALALISAGLLGYFAVDYIQNDFDAVEGWTALAASGLLFWTAWFCHGAAQHTNELKDNINNNGPALALALIVFLTVFREGAEIVAFLTALWVAGTSVASIGTGALIGLGLLAILCMVASKQLKKIPVAKIFRTSRWIFTALAVYFLYYGLHELLE